MQPSLVDVRFYQTYYLANVVMNVVHAPVNYLRNLEAFSGDGRIAGFARPFPRHSALHQFIEFLYESILFEELLQLDDSLDLERALCDRRIRASQALDYHEIPHIAFADWALQNARDARHPTVDDAVDYVRHLFDSGPLESLMSRTVDEVFYVVFGNRLLLKLFNEMMAGEMQLFELDDPSSEPGGHFRRDGTLLRADVPRWAQRAVWFRDRGMCALCKTNVSGLLSISETENYDHIVPLARGGLNDVTNLQLLCAPCNNKKRAGVAVTSTTYERWY